MISGSSLIMSLSQIHTNMFWFKCLQVVSLCLHDSLFWISFSVKSSMRGWCRTALCSSLFSHVQHILIRRWAAFLRLAHVSHPSPSHFSMSMAFHTFFVTSLALAAIEYGEYGESVAVAGRSSGWRIPLSQSSPYLQDVSSDPVRSCCPTFCVNAS